MWSKLSIQDLLASGIIAASVCVYSAFSLYISFLPDNKVADIFGRTRPDLMATAAAGAALLLVIPALKVSSTIYNTYMAVIKLQHPAVQVERHNTTNAIIRFCKRYHYNSITVYLGFPDNNLVSQLIPLIHSNPHLNIYINPGVIETMINCGLFTTRPSASHNIFDNIFVTDCPRESCVVFAMGQRWHCLTARIIPAPAGSCWTATLDPGSEFTDYLRETFETFYHSTMSPISSVAMMRFLSSLNTRRMEDTRTFTATKKMYFASRRNAYKFISNLLLHAERSFYAIDFMVPSEWGHLPGYEHAHQQVKERNLTRERIYCYDLDEIKSRRPDYDQYIIRQLEFNVKLSFINKNKVRDILGGDTKGFVIIDEQVILVAEESRDHDECATIDFTDEKIREYLATFASVKGRKPIEITKTQDIDSIMTPDISGA